MNVGKGKKIIAVYKQGPNLKREFEAKIFSTNKVQMAFIIQLQLFFLNYGVNLRGGTYLRKTIPFVPFL